MRECHCGSGRPSYELLDARGIYVSRVCEDCEPAVKAQYRDDVFTDSDYPTAEPVEEEAS